jgi:MoxR-like ATPase
MTLPTHPHGKTIQDVSEVQRGFEQLGYIADRGLATVVFLLTRLGTPILLEGHTGLGKTEVAKVLASFLGAPLIRLQCYEGLDVNSAVYEWNYQKQLLAIKIQESAGTSQSVAEKEKFVFGPDFLLERPLLKAVRAENISPILLIDEIDRADEAFEAFLLELLSDFQISIPELGTIRAKHPPYVVLTSNRNRELSEALKRRCLYHWIEYPSLEKELKIVSVRLPGIEQELSRQVVGFVQALRKLNLSRSPGIAETLDWAQSLTALSKDSLDLETVEATLGCLSKDVEDAERIRSAGIEKILSQVT